jgi:HAD superfamily hydrolase (TIGR01549 family)
MINFTGYKNIFWDFDGVLMDSMPVRDKGFEKVLENFPKEQIDKLMAYHRRNGGLSRYVKFRYFYEEILLIPITEGEVNELALRFSEIMLQLLIDEKLLITDSLSFVKDQHQNYNMHIVSGSDGKELNIICGKLGISQFFNSIHGSPTPKKKLVADIMEQNGYKPEETVLIGDSINDYEAAVVNSIDFIGYNNKTLIEELKCKYVESFASL